MKNQFNISFFTVFLLLSIQFTAAQNIIGADISSLQDLESHSVKFYEDGFEKDIFSILSDNHFNTIRLRLWHSPSSGSNNLEKTLLMAQRLKEKNFKFLLDFHYSDTWADPGHQSKPAVWENLTFEELKDSVFHYSKNVIKKLEQQNTPPDYVQIGNEISCGFLWDSGKICDPFNTPEQWKNFSELLTSAINGVKSELTNPDQTKIIIHSDKGAKNTACKWFFENLLNNNVEFDIIGLSYYPWWSGSLDSLQQNLSLLEDQFNKEIFLLETAYPWTLGWQDSQHNIVGLESQLLPEYEATPEGQKNYLQRIYQITSSTDKKLVTGLFYWEPQWLATTDYGSGWENLTLFDFNGNTLPAMSVFKEELTNTATSEKPKNFELKQNYPNPFNPSTKISFYIPENTFVELTIYNYLGEKIKTVISSYVNAGNYSRTISMSNFPSGVYFYRLTAKNYSETKKMLLIK